MNKNSLIHARIELDLKKEAENILAELGMSSAEAIRLFYRQICLTRGLPFDLKLSRKIPSNVRLPLTIIASIVKAFSKNFLKGDQLILFGSRVHPEKRGGDIDLYVRTASQSYEEADERKIMFLCELKKHIEDQKVDVVVRLESQTLHELIDHIVSNEGVQLV